MITIASKLPVMPIFLIQSFMGKNVENSIKFENKVSAVNYLIGLQNKKMISSWKDYDLVEEKEETMRN